jgi:hypothetical protein
MLLGSLLMLLLYNNNNNPTAIGTTTATSTTIINTTTIITTYISILLFKLNSSKTNLRSLRYIYIYIYLANTPYKIFQHKSFHALKLFFSNLKRRYVSFATEEVAPCHCPLRCTLELTTRNIVSVPVFNLVALSLNRHFPGYSLCRQKI